MLKKIALLLLLVSCDLAKVNDQEARKVAESLMKDMISQNYADLDKYYTASFNESEPREVKEEKLKKLLSVMGPVKSFELIGTKHDNSIDNGGPKVELRYKLVCEKVTAIHTLVIINDEGTHKIAFQNFENQ